MSNMFEDYGYGISDQDGDLRDISAVLKELEEIQNKFSTHAMSSYHESYLQGKEEMLAEVIEYLKRV